MLYNVIRGDVMNYSDKKEMKFIIESMGYDLLSEDFKKEKDKIVVKNREGYVGVILLGLLVRDKKEPCYFSNKNPYVIDNIKLLIETKAPNLVLVSNIFEGYKKNLHFKCKYHGDYFANLANIQKGYNCRQCAKERKADEFFENLKEEFAKKGYSVLIKREDYIDSKTRFPVMDKHGYKFMTTYEFIDKFKPSCFSAKNPYVLENIKRWLEINGDETIELLDSVYENAHSHLNLYCKIHKVKFTMTWNNLSKGKKCRLCAIDRHKGENNNKFNPNLTDEERWLKRKLYGEESYAKWRTNVFQRDNYSCILCGTKGRINAHHKNSWDKHPDDRLNVDNGVTLCIDCHKDFHKKYGAGNNTEQQFEEWFENRIKDISKSA